jgi:hypothetical protein
MEGVRKLRAETKAPETEDRDLSLSCHDSRHVCPLGASRFQLTGTWWNKGNRSG